MSSSTQPIKWTLAARGSPLSRIQSNAAKAALHRAFPGTGFSELWITTTGDRKRDSGREELPTPGFFEKEVDLAVLDGRADIAVHSSKDIPSDLPKGLAIIAALPRGPPGDVLVGWDGRPPSIGALPAGFRVGTSSVRRRAMVRYSSPEAETVFVRGNVGTRVEKLKGGACDALILAEAGLERLGLDPPFRRLALSSFPPAPGQGIMALVASEERFPDFEPMRTSAREAWWELLAERAFLSAIGGGCSKALGGHADYARKAFVAAEWAEDGSSRRKIGLHEPESEPQVLGERAASLLKKARWVRRR